jgi:hypothetical protein
MFTICTKATVPSCMRVPPETGAASRGRPSAVARCTADTSRSAEALPMEPARNLNSQATTATRRPCMRPSPVTTDSSRPVFSCAARSSAAYSSEIGPRTGDVSQETQEPSSSTRSISSFADRRSLTVTLPVSASDASLPS